MRVPIAAAVTSAERTDIVSGAASPPSRRRHRRNNAAKRRRRVCHGPGINQSKDTVVIERASLTLGCSVLRCFACQGEASNDPPFRSRRRFFAPRPRPRRCRRRCKGRVHATRDQMRWQLCARAKPSQL
eukprot:6179632-Pleurochrysis_carterae.AAC.1